MKVALVTSNLSNQGGGIAAVVENLSASLLDAGLDVAVFGVEDDAWLNGGKRAWRGAPARTARVFGPAAAGYAPDMLKQLLAWAPDVVHTHGIWMHPSRSVLQWARATGRPYAVSPHGMLHGWALQNSPHKKRLAGWLYEYGHLRHAACLHALCSAEVNDIRAFGIKQPVLVNPNGVTVPTIGESPSPPWAGVVAPGDKVMLYLGRIHPKKNLQQFLDAWASVKPDWRLAIAGWDQAGHLDELKARSHGLGIDSSVMFLGPLFGEKKDAAYRNADAFVLPSLSEGLPMTVLESWAYGVPVLMTEECNLPIGFASGAAQRLSLSPADMRRDLKQFLSLDLAAMNAKARRLAADAFQWSTIADKFAETYRWLAGIAAMPELMTVENYHCPLLGSMRGGVDDEQSRRPGVRSVLLGTKTIRRRLLD